MNDIELTTFKYIGPTINKIKFHIDRYDYNNFLNEYYTYMKYKQNYFKYMTYFNFTSKMSHVIKLRSVIVDIEILIYGYSLILNNDILLIIKISYYNVILNNIYYYNKYEILKVLSNKNTYKFNISYFISNDINYIYIN